MIAKLCAFYGVGVGDLLEYDPNMQEASYTEGVLVPA
jgi:DNA-binding Xre family transcriptional regulator